MDYTKKLFSCVNLNNCVIIHTMRHPVNALQSPIRNWLKFNNGKVFFSKRFIFSKRSAINGLNDLINLNKKVYVVILENLIKNKKRVMRDFCRVFNIKSS